VQGGAVEAVVVVPLERGAFGTAVLAQVVDVGFPPPGPQQQVVAGLARGQAGGDPAVERSGLGSGQATRLAVELGPVVAAVEVDRELADRGRQAVVEGDLGAVPGGPPDRRPRKGAPVGPEAGLRAGEDLLLGLADRDLEVGPGQLARDRQAGAEGLGRLGGRRFDRQRQRPTAPLSQGEQDRQGAAAEGAEESSTPQAWRG